jgi:hypothetical protein
VPHDGDGSVGGSLVVPAKVAVADRKVVGSHDARLPRPRHPDEGSRAAGGQQTALGIGSHGLVSPRCESAFSRIVVRRIQWNDRASRNRGALPLRGKRLARGRDIGGWSLLVSDRHGRIQSAAREPGSGVGWRRKSRRFVAFVGDTMQSSHRGLTSPGRPKEAWVACPQGLPGDGGATR